MDHMRISGTEPSSVILSQTKTFKKLKSDAQKVPSDDGVIPEIHVCPYCRYYQL